MVRRYTASYRAADRRPPPRPLLARDQMLRASAFAEPRAR